MEFATLDKMITELEKEKDVYVKSMDARIADIKECIVKMKEMYRNETMPEESGMVEYLLERAKKRLGDAVIEASDIPEDLMDDFFNVTERKVDVKRIVLGYRCNVRDFGLFFTDKELYVWVNDLQHSYSVYPYKAILDLSFRDRDRSNIIAIDKMNVDVDVDKDTCIENSGGSLSRILNFAEKQEQKAIVRLLLDLRDYANRGE